MKTYALLCNPGTNRVYAESSALFGSKELRAAAELCGIELTSINTKNIAGIDYLLFCCKAPLSDKQLTAVARLSVFFALFELLPEGALMPVYARGSFAFPENITSILKYGGKTNERFTHLMVQLGLCASHSRKNDISCFNLLDPMCGKGTTLFTAMRFGFNAAGIELQQSWAQDARTFAAQYLEKSGCKYILTTSKLSDSKARKIADISCFEYADDKEAFKNKRLRYLRIVRSDTLLAERFFPKQSFDMLVTDLPYGVQHTSKRPCGENCGRTKLSRSAAQLTDEALDGWLALLKPGASLVLAFNTLTTPRKELEEIAVKHSLELLASDEYNGFSHRVDASINRDILVAVKKTRAEH